MAFRAVHAQWGTVFAHLPDLGCGQTWEAVWKVRPPVPLTCDECRHPMYAKTSRNGLRFFAHAPHAPNCALALETLAHHLLKLELANAARDAGAHAEMEARGPDGTWRADVLASDPGGTWRTALEAQLAPITAADIIARTERMRADGVPSIWFNDRPRPPWLGVVPSVRLTRPDDGHLVIAEGLMKFDGYWQTVPATLVQFLDWAFAGRIVAHRRQHSWDGPEVVWTAPRYVDAFDDYLAELEREVERDERIRAQQQESYLRRQERAAKLAAENGPWQERWRVSRGSCEVVFHAVQELLKTGPAGFYGQELWPLRENPEAVRAVWIRAAEASGWRLPTAGAIRRARQEYERGNGA